MTYRIDVGETKQEAASFDDWHAPVENEDRHFDPKTGVITDSDNFTCWNLIGLKYFSREGFICDPPSASPLSRFEVRFL